ncbi:EscU/YscU/HrcU family type III secretion system export apparatus switch protein [Yoonia sp. 2307UL14-13]|uniref:EscU/YscU/HrcU family type III secretion system export apparatus switch protein n=1 Tax=Yoonia sp. 2307UL14-13 TaxID=3126506 RepID=UPI0030A138B2
MSAGPEDGDKPFAPSQKKLDDARKRGEIAKSVDLITAGAYLGFTIVLLAFGATSLTAVATAMMILLEQADDLSVAAFSHTGQSFIGQLIAETFKGTFALFVVPAACAILVVAGQRAFVFAPSKIAPKLDRISPISGFKNKFGRQGLFEFVKSTVKLTVYCVILGAFLFAQSDRIIGSLGLPPALILAEMGKMVVSLFIIVVLVAIVIGGVDLIWQQAEHQRKNMMSRKEMMDEMKESEGDPKMKQQRRQRAQDIAMNKMLSDVPGADVVIVNPTHFAVALKWDRTTGQAPICVAKGVDEIAARIREQAHEHAVPLHSDPPTARALHAGTEIGQQIAPEYYRPVAAAIRFAESIRQKARRS